jgi:MarR family multiple antibiotic resistance transcriptional regulator
MDKIDYSNINLEIDQENELWILMRQSGDLMSKLMDKKLEHTGLSTIQVALIFTIAFLGNKATPRRLSRRLGREPHTISEMLTRMEKQGLIKKINDLERKNMVRIEITDKGKKLYSATNDITRPPVMSALTEKEREEFRVYLMKIRSKAIQLLGKSYNLRFPPADY